MVHSKFIQPHFPVNNLSEQSLAPICHRSDEIPAWLRVIIFRQTDGISTSVSSLPIQQPPHPLPHRIKIRFGQTPGLGVLAAGMVGGQQPGQSPARSNRRLWPKSIFGAGHDPSPGKLPGCHPARSAQAPRCPPGDRAMPARPAGKAGS